MTPSRSLHDLKIIVTSTPKTGNNWVKQLLAATYNLPMYSLTEPFTVEEVNKLGERWIAHQHYYPLPDLLAWAEGRNVVFVTTTRHPGDTLLSLYHHIRNRQQGAQDHVGLAIIMQQDRKRPGKNMTRYVQNEFFYALNVSISWIRSGLSYTVRYEDLWRDPVSAMTKLTLQIASVDQERIKRAVVQSQIGMLRKLHDPKGQFFRKGAVGSWVQELPEEVKELFSHYEPYPSQLVALGYTMDPDDPLISAPAEEFVFHNPFDNLTHFDNGVAIPPIVEKLYLSVDADTANRWEPVERASTQDSFFDWLAAPAKDDPYRDKAVPLITNLAAYVYSIRKDLQLRFPDVYGRDRIGYAHWFAMVGREAYKLHMAYVLPILQSWTGQGEVYLSHDESNSLDLAPSSRGELAGSRRSQALDQALASSRVNPHLPIAWPTWPAGAWPKIVAVTQKVIRRLLQWYVNPIVEQQNRFNAAVVQSLTALWQENAQLQRQLLDQQHEKGAEGK
jgi:hypothetical protein